MPIAPLAPLEGFVIGVTADRRWAEQAELLERRGATVMHGPTISTEYLANDDALRAATDAVIARAPDYLIATTGIGMRAWFEAAQSWGMAARLAAALASTRVIARGPKASASVQMAGLTVWSRPDSERLDDALEALAAEDLSGRVVAFQHYGAPDARVGEIVTARGGTVVEVPVYRYGRPEDDGKAMALVAAAADGGVDAVTFTSAPAARNFVAVAERAGRADEVLAACTDRVVVACVGPICAAAAREAGLVTAIAPQHGRLGLLVRCLTDALQSRARILRRDDIDIVMQGRALTVGGERVELSAGEHALFSVLARRPGVVMAKATILRALDRDPTNVHALETTVTRLRRSLGAAGPTVQAVRGRGYRLAVEEAVG